MIGQVTGRENIQTVFEENAQAGNKFYRLKLSTGKDLGMESNNDDEEDWTIKARRLQNHLGRLSTGYYILMIYPNKNMSGAGVKEIPFYMENSTNSTSPAIGSLNNHSEMTPDQLDQKINAAVEKAVSSAREKWELEKRLEMMEMQIKEDAKPSAIERIATNPQLAPVIGHLISSFFGPKMPMGIAGTNIPVNHTEPEEEKTEETQDNEEQQEVSENQNTRLNRCILQLVEIEGGDTEKAIQFLERLLNYVEENPATLKMVKSIIGA